MKTLAALTALAAVLTPVNAIAETASTAPAATTSNASDEAGSEEQAEGTMEVLEKLVAIAGQSDAEIARTCSIETLKDIFGATEGFHYAITENPTSITAIGVYEDPKGNAAVKVTFDFTTPDNTVISPVEAARGNERAQTNLHNTALGFAHAACTAEKSDQRADAEESLEEIRALVAPKPR